MSIEEQKQENLEITPEKELENALESLNNGDWGELHGCLQECYRKISQAGLSAENRETMKTKLSELKTKLSTEEIPEEHKAMVESSIQAVEGAL